MKIRKEHNIIFLLLNVVLFLPLLLITQETIFLVMQLICLVIQFSIIFLGE